MHEDRIQPGAQYDGPEPSSGADESPRGTGLALEGLTININDLEKLFAGLQARLSPYTVSKLGRLDQGDAPSGTTTEPQPFSKHTNVLFAQASRVNAINRQMKSMLKSLDL